MTTVKAYEQTLGREFKGLTNEFVTVSRTYLLAQHLSDFYISSLTTVSDNSTDSTSYKTSNMARSPRYHLSVYTILIHLMALSPLLVPAQATSITSTCPTGSHPVLAAGSGNEWYSVCCSPEATIVASLTSNGPRCCTQPTSSDSLNLVRVSEWSTCTIIPVSAESCAASRNEQVWNDFHLRICREADSSHDLFPPESISRMLKSEDESAIETQETADNDATNVDDGLHLLPRQGTAQCPQDDSPVLVPSPDVRQFPVIACCNMLFNEKAVQTATGIFCCLNGTDECDEPADDVRGCPGANTINVQPFDLLVCPSRRKRSEERDEPQPASWCATHNHPQFCVRDTSQDVQQEIDDAVKKRSECDIAPENGNCSSAAPRSLRCPSLITLLSMLVLVTALFTVTTAADAGGAICPAGDTSVAGVIANGSDQYIVCCHSSHTRSVDINRDTGFSVCRNGQDQDYGLQADSVLGCAQPTDIVDIYGRGVFACKAGQMTLTTETVTAHPSLVTAIPSNSASRIRRSSNSVTLWSAVFISLIFSIEIVSARNVSNSDNTVDHQIDATQATSCPADAKAVSTIAVRNKKKHTYVVCCPNQAADMAAINFGNGKVICCFGPLCVYPSVDVQRCDGGVDDMMSVGYEVGGRSVCLVTDKAKRSSVESESSDIAAYNICPTGSKSTAADYPNAKGNYFACCPDDYSEKAEITNRGTGHVYCCDGVDCAGSALNALCADGAAPVEIKGDKVTVCRIDEVEKRAEASARTDMEFEKRKGGSHTSGAARGLSLSSPFNLLMTTILALAFVLMPAAAEEELIIRSPANYHWAVATADGMNGMAYSTGLNNEETYVACFPSPLNVPFQRDLALTDRPNKRTMCCAPGGDCSNKPSKAVCMSECRYKTGTEKVDLFGDGVELCKIDGPKIGNSLEKSLAGIDLQKRKGGGKGGGGCLGCTSTASHDHSMPSPLFLVVPAVLALISSLTKVGAASDEAAGEDRKPLGLRSRNSATTAPTQPTPTIAPAKSS